jgi:hypothetical protein
VCYILYIFHSQDVGWKLPAELCFKAALPFFKDIIPTINWMQSGKWSFYHKPGSSKTKIIFSFMFPSLLRLFTGKAGEGLIKKCCLLILQILSSRCYSRRQDTERNGFICIFCLFTLFFRLFFYRQFFLS